MKKLTKKQTNAYKQKLIEKEKLIKIKKPNRKIETKKFKKNVIDMFLETMKELCHDIIDCDEANMSPPELIQNSLDFLESEFKNIQRYK